ncbi:hypothetical protein WMF45_02650 [Sorangium sp. So ce448]|uniref:hypothetical protein n=1 Tax=Sorangium sp. So ce448 TaxID=3133314 RepID=UPI003F627114
MASQRLGHAREIPDVEEHEAERREREQPGPLDVGVRLSRRAGDGDLAAALREERPRREVALGDAREIWSLCAMLYELLSGRPPFSSRNALDGLRAVLQDAVPSLVDTCGLDADLWAIVERGLRKEPSSRWSSMRELGEALAAWLRARGVREDARGVSLEGEWLSAEEPRAPASRGMAPRLSWMDERGRPSRRWSSRRRVHRLHRGRPHAEQAAC